MGHKKWQYGGGEEVEGFETRWGRVRTHHTVIIWQAGGMEAAI